MQKLAYFFLSLSRPKKVAILIFADVFFSLIALWGAFSIRLGELYLPKGNGWMLFLISPLIAIPVFIKFGLYRAIIRYIGGRVLWAIFQATALYALIFSVIALMSNVGLVPRTVPILNWLFMLLLVGGGRFFACWWLGDVNVSYAGDKATLDDFKKNVVIYGAGSAGVQLASALAQGREYKPVAFIDDDVSLHKQKINNLRIYDLSSLSYLIERHKLTDVLLAIPSATRARRNEVIRLLEVYPVHVRSMPGLADLANGRVKVDALQEVEVADLLGRDAVSPDQMLLHANITGKVVMVTGAGGSIGSELCRQVLALKPTRLVLYELTEFALYSIEKELIQSLTYAEQQMIEIVAVMGSVVDGERVRKFCQAYEVQTIYHAAAYKHVPMMEKNPGQAVLNNVLGTLNTAQAAINANVETFVLISTDKAVRPTNTMGATKRIAELVLQALSQTQETTRFTMVRFGNVLGSSGSVVPLFRDQIAKGGPVTVTDPRIIRYFMTIPEAAQLVIQAGAMGQGGDVFVLEMGEPVKIVDMAKRMIHLSGLEVKDGDHPGGDIEIQFTGLRPGEKLFEELLIGDNVTDTSHPRIMRAEEEVLEWTELQKVLMDLEVSSKNDDFESVRGIMSQVVSGFKPQCEISDLLWIRK